MATVNYTTLLGLALPTTGDLSGTWGNEVNEYISKYVDASVAGTQTISGSQTAVTLSPTNGASLVQAAATSSGSSQYAIINCTGNPASTLTITVTYSSLTNAQFSKTYAVINATSTSQSVVVRATTSSGTSSGVTVASGERCLITWNGSNFVKVSSTVALPAGSTTQVQYNNAGALAGSANLTFDGTTLTVNNLTDSSLTSGRVTYATTGGNLTDSANLTFDGTNLGVGGAALSLPAGYTVSQVSGTSGAGLFRATSTSVDVRFQADQVGSTALINVASNHPLAFNVNATEQMRLTSTGLGIGTSSPGAKLDVNTGGASNTMARFTSNGSYYSYILSSGVTSVFSADTSGNNSFTVRGASNQLELTTNGSIRATITSAGFTRPVAYADTVSALGNTGTATTINLQNANVFTATLTGNCTFTLSNPIATGSSSFTLILTNDGTAGRTVAWAGGAFRFPGGAASLSRTTTANATDIWVFFTPDGGTTWYGNIAMKNMAA